MSYGRVLWTLSNTNWLRRCRKSSAARLEIWSALSDGLLKLEQLRLAGCIDVRPPGVVCYWLVISCSYSPRIDRLLLVLLPKSATKKPSTLQASEGGEFDAIASVDILPSWQSRTMQVPACMSGSVCIICDRQSTALTSRFAYRTLPAVTIG